MAMAAVFANQILGLMTDGNKSREMTNTRECRRPLAQCPFTLFFMLQILYKSHIKSFKVLSRHFVGSAGKMTITHIVLFKVHNMLF